MLRSRLTAGALALALALAVPAGAGASPLRWLDPGNLWVAAWQRLAAFWGEERPAGITPAWAEQGIGMDPDGAPARPPAAGVTSVWAEHGIGMDPNGTPIPPPTAAAPLPPPPH